jgi:N-acetylglutamate synthase-like GNAT family acetyltransferase
MVSKMPLKMRKAASKDVKDLCILMDEMNHTNISEDDMVERLELVANSQIDSLFVCEENKKVVGLLGFRIRENLEEKSRFGEISAIVVDKDKKRHGIGRFMMGYAEKLAHEHKCKGMWLVSGFLRAEEAHEFYRQLEFQITGYRFVKLFK